MVGFVDEKDEIIAALQRQVQVRGEMRDEAIHEMNLALQKLAMAEAEIKRLRSSNVALHDDGVRFKAALDHAEAVLANVDSIYGTKSLEKLRELMKP